MSRSKGFTLIEISIVLVIIGLIVGGVLVGKDLIEAATIRSQISQIEKYQTAVNVFKSKYNCIPGDCVNAANFGFAARGSEITQGNGDGNIEGAWSGGGTRRMILDSGEGGLFWRDLSDAGLISEKFNTSPCCSALPSPVNEGTTPSLRDLTPPAKLGRGNYVYIYSHIDSVCCGVMFNRGVNYFGLSAIGPLSAGAPTDTPTLAIRPIEALNIDTKIDDGLPQSGAIQAKFLGTNTIRWAHGNANTGVYGTTDTTATSASATTCYDNGNIGSATQKYSTSINGGTGLNCGLQIRAGF
jgi:prepilin-type N-terminal cleavage/methylation domain-containing protein